MPFIRTSVRKGTGFEKKKAIVDGVHHALIDSIGMPADELFNMVSEYDPEDFFYDRAFNGIARSDHAVVLEITMRRGRSDAMKRDLYARIADNLDRNAGVSPRDVYIFMHENDYSDWSAGNGMFAMTLVRHFRTELRTPIAADSTPEAATRVRSSSDFVPITRIS